MGAAAIAFAQHASTPVLLVCCLNGGIASSFGFIGVVSPSDVWQRVEPHAHGRHLMRRPLRSGEVKGYSPTHVHVMLSAEDFVQTLEIDQVAVLLERPTRVCTILAHHVVPWSLERARGEDSWIGAEMNGFEGSANTFTPGTSQTPT